ncbi:radical SAM protein [Chloroflexota bacterium]
MKHTKFIPYRPKTILNKSKRADHWFWTRYSAYPYKGCQHGCEFCYCSEQKFSPYDDPDDFAYRIQPKESAPELLRRALSRAPIDVISTGDYQPAERKFELSRKMLEVCYELGFPVFILERSPLVLRDLELLKAIHQKARLVVVFSAISAPGSVEYERTCQMERLAPPSEKRFEAMAQIAAAGIPTGACMMPLLPGLCDTPENLENVVRWTADHGGSFVMAGGLTLSDQQRDYFFGVLAERFPDLLATYRRLYPPGSYSPKVSKWPGIALQIKEYCHKYGIRDRMPRPIIPGEKRATNKLVVEALANQTYDMEIQGAPGQRVWAYRKAAWAIEDLEQDIKLIYSQMGVKGLQSIPNVGPRLAGQVEALIQTFS